MKRIRRNTIRQGDFVNSKRLEDFGIIVRNATKKEAEEALKILTKTDKISPK